MNTINNVRPNVLSGGQAIPIGNNFYFMRGRKHEQGGIDIGKNLEVEDGELMQITPKFLKVFSAQKFLGGKSPTELVLNGANPNKVFKAQEKYKDRYNLKDDGTKKMAKYGEDEPIQLNEVVATGKNLNYFIKNFDGSPSIVPDEVIRKQNTQYKFNLFGNQLRLRSHESNAKTLEEAHNNARKEGYATFKFNGKTYRANYSTPEYNFYQYILNNDDAVTRSYKNDNGEIKPEIAAWLLNSTIKQYGITPDRVKDKSIFNNYIYRNLPNYGAQNPISAVYNLLTSDIDRRYDGLTKDDRGNNIDYKNDETRLEREDEISLTFGRPMPHKRIKVSNYRPENHINRNSYYFTPNNSRRRNHYINIPTTYIGNNKFRTQTINNTLNEYTTGVNTNNNYTWFYDLWDLSPAGNQGKNTNNIIDKTFNSISGVKPFEFYDRQYYNNKERIIYQDDIPMIYKNRYLEYPYDDVNEDYQKIIRKDNKQKTKKAMGGKLDRHPFTGKRIQSKTTDTVNADSNISPVKGKFGLIKSIGNFVNDNPEDVIGAGSNILGSVGSWLTNNIAINRMKAPSAPVSKIATKLKTRININPQLDKMRETVGAYERQVRQNTSSSATALNRINRTRFSGAMQTNQLYADKENKETQLINQDKLNQQQVANANVDAYNQYSDRLVEHYNKKSEARAENINALISGVNSSVQNVLERREKRAAHDKTNAALMSANPDLPAEHFYGLGLISKKQLDDYRKMYPLKKTK